MKFNASHNNLIEIPREFYKHTREIREIDFSNNQIEEINSIFFTHAVKLEKIRLSHNNISKISKNTFVDLNNLELIDLRNNKIMIVDFELPNNRHLKVLYVQNNLIKNVGCDFFLLVKNMTSIYITWANVEVIDTSCLANQFDIVSSSELEGVFNELNETFKFHVSKFSLKNIRLLKIGQNQTKNVKEIIPSLGSFLEEMDLSGNYIGKLNYSSFKKFTTLNRLILSNTHLVDFDFEIFEYSGGWPHNLNQLDISYNKHIILHNIAFIENKRITDINIAENQLNNAMELLKYIKPVSDLKLDLSGNYLEWDEHIFSRFSHMRFLRLSNVNLPNFDVNVFHKYIIKFRGELDISNNNLEGYNFAAISFTLNLLSGFRAANCNIHDASKLLGYFSIQHDKIDLSGNPIGEVKFDTFKILKLHHLNLANANISSFNFRTLEHDKKLYSLNISNNILRKVDLHYLAKGLRQLYLDGNELTELNNLNRSNFPLLTHLSIADNNFSCDYLNETLTMINKEWSDLQLIGNSLHQKHGKKCEVIIETTTEQNKMSTATESVTVTNSTSTTESRVTPTEKTESDSWYINFAIAGFSTTLGVLITLTSSIIYRKCSSRKNHLHKYYEPAVLFKRDAPELPPRNDIPEIQPAQEDNHNQEPVYATVEEQQEYNHLQFNFSAQPIADRNGHYHNTLSQRQDQEGEQNIQPNIQDIADEGDNQNVEPNANIARPYDHLQFEFDPLSIPNTNQHYHNYLLKQRQDQDDDNADEDDDRIANVAQPYDRLQFEFEPMSIPNSNQHYHNYLLKRQAQDVNLQHQDQNV